MKILKKKSLKMKILNLILTNLYLITMLVIASFLDFLNLFLTCNDINTVRSFTNKEAKMHYKAYMAANTSKTKCNFKFAFTLAQKLGTILLNFNIRHNIIEFQ